MASKQFAQLLLNKVINDQNFGALTKYNITQADMPTKADAETFRFIKQYHDQQGAVPSYATVSAQVQDFEYIPDVSDTYEYLAKQVKDYAGKVAVFKVLEDPELQKKVR